MDSRIKIEKGGGELNISIKAFFDKKKQQLLLVWIILFSICGIAIFMQFFQDYDAGTKVFFGVYVAFWIFFEFKVVYAYRWRKYGEEKIIIKDDQLTLLKTIGGRGVSQHYSLADIDKIDFFKDDTGTFVSSMNTSYWNINKYHLVLIQKEESVPFAIDITHKQAKNIINELRKYLN